MPAVLEVADLVKDYRGLRPLRIATLTLDPGERVALSGLDAAAADALVSLLTGAALPDRGVIRVLGQPTSEITGGDAWLASLDRFGIMSPRAVLLEESTVAQNLAMPFGLAIDPVPPDVIPRVETLADEAGIPRDWLERAMASAPPAVRARVHLARAVALAPSALLLEHPTIAIEPAGVASFAADVVRLTDRRGLATLAITEDHDFAERLNARWLTLEPATGALVSGRARRGWFR